jgi:hypothetical protein
MDNGILDHPRNLQDVARIRLRRMARILPNSCMAHPKELSRSASSSQAAKPLTTTYLPQPFTLTTNNKYNVIIIATLLFLNILIIYKIIII